MWRQKPRNLLCFHVHVDIKAPNATPIDMAEKAQARPRHLVRLLAALVLERLLRGLYALVLQLLPGL